MKIGNFPMVARIVAARDSLIAQRDRGKIHISINSVPQDDELVACARAAIIAELDRRIEELNKDLEPLGVDMSDARQAPAGAATRSISRA